MKKSDVPSNLFVGAILRAYEKAVSKGEEKPQPSALWDYIVMECLRSPGGFITMFEWDTSRAKNINRIGTIMECIERGHVPGLVLEGDERGRIVISKAPTSES
ncbi:MAG: hypothetical protein KKA68_21140 [Gammaproteobacteria bacterium]|nr:hypothetical protein [Gammaproteobacteria bacterium]